MRKVYIKPEMQTVSFSCEDIITASAPAQVLTGSSYSNNAGSMTYDAVSALTTVNDALFPSA